jgi:hypothetical protein
MTVEVEGSVGEHYNLYKHTYESYIQIGELKNQRRRYELKIDD